MLVESGDPPLSPWLKNWKSLLFSQQLKPLEGASDGDIGIDIAGEDPDSESCLHHDGVYPHAGIGVHDIVEGDIIAALLEVNRVDMQLFEDERAIEELHDALAVVTRSLIDIQVCETTTLPHLSALPCVLEVAGTVYIEDAGFGGIEFLVLYHPQILAGLRMIA